MTKLQPKGIDNQLETAIVSLFEDFNVKFGDMWYRWYEIANDSEYKQYRLYLDFDCPKPNKTDAEVASLVGVNVLEPNFSKFEITEVNQSTFLQFDKFYFAITFTVYEK